MTQTIGSLAYKLSMDSSQLNAAAVLTKAQMREVHKIMRETKDPAQVLEEKLNSLQTLYEKGAISLEQYGQTMVKLKTSTPEAIKAQKEHAAAMAEAEAIMSRHQTTEERHAQSMKDLERLKPHLSQHAYNAELQRLNGLLPESIKRQEDAARAEEHFNQRMRDGAALTRQMETVEERRARELHNLNDLLDHGAISQETYNRAYRRAHQQDSPQHHPNVSQELIGRIPGGGPIAGILADMKAMPPTAVAAGVAIAGVVAAGAAAHYLVTTFKEAADEIDHTHDRATALGLSFNELTIARRGFGEVAGADAETIDTAIQKFQQHLVEARAGTGDLAADLERFKLSPDALLQLSPVEAVQQIAEAMREVESPAERIKLAIDMFGKGGAALVPILQDGASELKDMEKHLQGTGRLLSPGEIEGIGRMNDSLERAWDYVVGFGYTWTATIAPAVTATINMLTNSSAWEGLTNDVNALAAGVFNLANAVSMGELARMTEKEREIAEINAHLNTIKRDRIALLDLERQKQEQAATQAKEQAEQAFASKDLELDIQYKELFMSNPEKAQWAAQRAGMSEEQAAKIKAAQDLIDTEKENLRLEALARDAAREREQEELNQKDEILKKLDKELEFKKEIEKIAKLRDSGKLTYDQAAQAAKLATDEQVKKDIGSRPTASTVVRGSDEEYKIFVDAQKKGVDKQIAATKAVELVMKDATSVLKQILDKTGVKLIR